MTTPTWYEILGVKSDATAEQIKAAWRDATDKFEPGTGGSQFRMFNEAADVLLDPEKRTAYDADLKPEPTVIAPTLVEPPAETPAAPDAEVAVAEPPTSEAPGSTTPVPVEHVPDAPTTVSQGKAMATAILSSALSVAILAVVTVTALVAAVLLGINLNHRTNTAADNPDSYSAGLGAQASSVAERAVGAVLSYNYLTMANNRAESLKFMTPAYQKTYEKIFDALINGTPTSPGGAIKTKAVVTATVRTTSVVDSERNRVRVLVFVDQAPVLNGKAGQLLANRVIATMVLSNGHWLLDNLDPLSAGF